MNKFKLIFLLAVSFGVASNAFSMEEKGIDHMIFDESVAPSQQSKNAKRKQKKKEEAEKLKREKQGVLRDRVKIKRAAEKQKPKERATPVEKKTPGTNPGHPSIPQNNDENEQEIPGTNSGHPSTPQNNDGWFNSFSKWFKGDKTSALASTDTPGFTSSPSRLEKHKGKVAVGGMAAVGVVIAALLAKKFLDQTSEEKFSELDEQDLPDSDQQLLNELRRLLKNPEDRDDSDQDEERDIDSDIDSPEEKFELTYQEKYAECDLYGTPLKDLGDKLNLSAFERWTLEMSLTNETFDQKLKEFNANEDALKLAEVVQEKYNSNQKILATLN